MSAAVIDFATRELIRNRESPLQGAPVTELKRGDVGDLRTARQMLRPRSKMGSMFGLTGRDLDRAIMRIETGARFMPAAEFFKRTFDILLSALVLFPLVVLLPIIALILRSDSPGPLFFRQKRMGLNGEEFGMLKFRTMRVDAEEQLALLLDPLDGTAPLFKLRDDPRVTKMGRILRRYSLDELPQIWNVLRGQMSVVGPRPPLPREVQDYDGIVSQRLHVKPGITGLWQVSGPRDLSWEESVRLDLYYVENWTLAVDLVIISRTLKAIISPSPTMY